MTNQPFYKPLIDLRRHEEPGTGGGEPGGGEPGTGGGEPGAGGQGGDTEPPAGEPKPFAIFPDEASFMGRVSREAKKLFKTQLKELGFENEAQFRDAIAKIKNTRTEPSKGKGGKEGEPGTIDPDIELKIRQANEARDEAIRKANNTLKLSEAKIQAIALGVNPERVNHFLKLANLDDVSVNDGEVDINELKSVLTELLNEVPEFKAKPTVPKGGTDFGGAGSGEPKPLTLDQIKHMSTEEIMERIDEVNALLGNK